MSPAIVPGRVQHYTTVDVAILLSIIVGSFVIIIIVARCLIQKYPPATTALTKSVYKYEDESYRRTGIPVEDLPVRRYTKRIVPPDKINGEAQNSSTYLPSLLHPTRKDEMPRNRDEKAAGLATRLNDSLLINDSDTPKL
jgi:hypothetical protein